MRRFRRDQPDSHADDSYERTEDIGLEKLAALPPALARLVVRRLAEAATGGGCARAAARLDDVLALDSAGAALDVGDGARAVVRGGELRFTRTPPLAARGGA